LQTEHRDELFNEDDLRVSSDPRSAISH
jgi:hypothetical protein